MTVREGALLCGRYRLQRSIGRGGMAEVFLAFDSKRQAPVAVKILREDLAEDPDFGKRFRREADALARLDHPNIVHYYAFEQDGPVAFIVMDYIEGLTLRRRIADAQGPLPLDEITGIVRDLCGALYYAHQNGLAHRDLKPGNIMLPADGHALLADFGISCALEGVTHTGSSLGTPAYMSPEQIACEAVDARSDIYSLGVLLFEMAAGRRPFTGEEPGLTQTGTTARMREAHALVPPPNPRSINPYLPEAAARVILRALAKQPEQRWPDVLSLRKAWETSLGAATAAEIPLPPRRQEVAPAPRPQPGRAEPAPAPRPPRRQGVAAAPKPQRQPSRGLTRLPAALDRWPWLPYAVGGVLLVVALVLVLASRPGANPSAAEQSVAAPSVAAPSVASPAAVTEVAAAPRPRPPAAGGGVKVVGGAQPTAAADEPAPAEPTPRRGLVIVDTGKTNATDTPTADPAPGQREPTVIPTVVSMAVRRESAGAPTNTGANSGQTATRAPAGTAARPEGGVTLLRPQNGARIMGQTEFAWQGDAGFALAPGETYELIVWGPGEDPLTAGRSPVGAGLGTTVTANLTGVERALLLRPGGTFFWGVRLWRGDRAVRMLSAGRAFVYERMGGGSGGVSQLPTPAVGDTEK